MRGCAYVHYFIHSLDNNFMWWFRNYLCEFSISFEFYSICLYELLWSFIYIYYIRIDNWPTNQFSLISSTWNCFCFILLCGYCHSFKDFLIGILFMITNYTYIISCRYISKFKFIIVELIVCLNLSMDNDKVLIALICSYKSD